MLKVSAGLVFDDGRVVLDGQTATEVSSWLLPIVMQDSEELTEADLQVAREMAGVLDSSGVAVPFAQGDRAGVYSVFAVGTLQFAAYQIYLPFLCCSCYRDRIVAGALDPAFLCTCLHITALCFWRGKFT